MAEVALAEFIALIQDGLQRSYSYIEDVAEASRDARREGVILTVGEVTLSIPVAFALRTQSVDLNPLLATDRATTASSLVRTLLSAPMAAPELRKALREQAYSAIARGRPELAQSAAEPAPAEVRESRERAKAERAPEAVPTLEVKLTDSAKELVKRTTTSGILTGQELMVSLLGEDSARTTGASPGSLEIHFKPVLE